jgi:rubrerythrin
VGQREAIRSTVALYAHALAIEREAAARYADLARLMIERGNGPLGALFAHLAAREMQHAKSIAARTQGLDLPLLKSWQYGWSGAGPPEGVARELASRFATPHDALKVGLEAEQRARDFYEQVFATATDLDVKLLAAALAQEEAQHVEWLERALATTPDPRIDWEHFVAGPSGEG